MKMLQQTANTIYSEELLHISIFKDNGFKLTLNMLQFMFIIIPYLYTYYVLLAAI